jgi:hypothetical protein
MWIHRIFGTSCGESYLLPARGGSQSPMLDFYYAGDITTIIVFCVAHLYFLLAYQLVRYCFVK